MKIIIVRHAEPDYSIDGLTPKGQREAQLLSERLVRISDIRGIYQSPLGRAQLTAGYTLEKLGRSAETLPWLAEFRGHCYDALVGRDRICWDYRQEQWHDREEVFREETWTDSPLFQGGNVTEIWQETVEGADRVLAKHGYLRDGHIWRCDSNEKGAILFFCHFGVACALLAYLTGLSPVPLWHSVCMLPSSVTELVSQERTKGEVDWRISRLGDLSHLDAAGEPPSTAGLYAECYDGRDSTSPIEWEKRRQA